MGLLPFLERSGARLPPPLMSFVQGVLATREQQKTERPLCSYLKATGVCRSLVGPQFQQLPGGVAGHGRAASDGGVVSVFQGQRRVS